MTLHDEILEAAAAAIDFPPTPAERRRIDAHLAGCAACARDVVALRRDSALLLAAIPAPVLPERRQAEILQAILRPPRGVSPLRLVAIAALLALSVLGTLIAGAEMLRQTQDDLAIVPQPSASTPLTDATPTPSTEPSTTAELTSSPSPADPLAGCNGGGGVALATYEAGGDLQWQRLPDGGVFDNAMVLDVVASSNAGGTTFVAVGERRTDADPQAPWSPAAWTSTDGIEWAVASEPPSARRLLRVGDAYLAWDGASVWRSVDGDRWEDLGPITPDATPRWLEIVGFEPVGTCVLAAGYEELAETSLLRTWLSPDGSAWTEVTPPMPEAWRGRIEGITSTADGLVAWGSNATDSGAVGATLHSSDGREWTVGDALEAEGFARDYMTGIALGPSGLVAVGGQSMGEAGSDPPPAAAWTSQDGLRWTRIPVDTGGVDGGFLTVTWDGSQFLATRRPGLDAEVWSSPDGTTWTLESSAPDVASDGAQEGCMGSTLCPMSSVVGLAAGERAVVAFGYRDFEGGNLGVLWTAPRQVP